MASRLSWTDTARIDYTKMPCSARHSVATTHSNEWTPLTTAVATILAIYEDATALVWDMRDIWKHSMTASTELVHLESAFKECHAIVDAALLAGKGRFGCEFEFADNTTILELRHVTSYLDSRLLGPISRGPVSQDSKKRASLKATSTLLQVAEEGCQQAVKCLRDLYILLEDISSVIGHQEPPLEQTTSTRAPEPTLAASHAPPRRRSSTESLSVALNSQESRRWARSDSLFDTFNHQNRQPSRRTARPAPLRMPTSSQVPPPQRSAPLAKASAPVVKTSLHFNNMPRDSRYVGSPGPTLTGTLPSSPIVRSPTLPQRSPQRPTASAQEVPIVLSREPLRREPLDREKSWFSQTTVRTSSLASSRPPSLLNARSISRSSSKVEVPPSLQLRRPGFSRPSSRAHRPSYERPRSPFSDSQISSNSGSLRSRNSVSALSDASSLRRGPSDSRRSLYERRPFSFVTEPLVENPASPVTAAPRGPSTYAPELIYPDPRNEATPPTDATEVEMHATVGGPVDCWTPTFCSAPDYPDSDSSVETSTADDRDAPWFDEPVSDASSSTTDLHASPSVSSITTTRSHEVEPVANTSRPRTRDPHSSMMPQEWIRDPHSSMMPQAHGQTYLSPPSTSVFTNTKHHPHPHSPGLLIPDLEAPTVFLPIPSAWNNYLGFCSGAYLAQTNSPHAMVKRQVMNVHHSKTTILKCSNSKCVFSGAGSDTKIWEAHSIRFRRPFLIKTHVAQKRVKKALYTFQCPICVLLKMTGTVIQGTDAYLGHIATHRGQQLPQQLLETLRCVNNRWAEDGEEFDINILPFDVKRPAPSRPAPPPPTSTPNPPGSIGTERQSSVGVSELGGEGRERNVVSPVSELM